MKTIFLKLAQFSALFLFGGIASTTSLADSDPTICALLPDRDSINYVIPNASDRTKPFIKRLNIGGQNVAWKSSGWLYFTVTEKDDQVETVDHFRVVTIDDANGAGDRVNVGIYRSTVDTACHSHSFNWWYGYLREGQGNTSVKLYDERRNKLHKYNDNDLNRWHFDWVHTLDRKQKCANTADYIPAIQDEAAGQDRGSTGGGVLSSDLIAATPQTTVPVPANVSAIQMVLVHRKKDGTSCLGIPLGQHAIPEKTKINGLRFRNKNQRFLGPITVINWVE